MTCTIDDIMRIIDQYAGEMAASEASYALDNDEVGKRRYDAARQRGAEIRAALEELAAPHRRPTVGMMNHDAAAVLAGRTMGCSTLDGAQVLVRLWTADELLERARAVGSGMSRAKAVELTTPIGGQR